MKKVTLLGISAVFCTVSWLSAQDSAPSGLELMNETHHALYYAGDGGKANVSMTLTDKKGRTRERTFWMFRTDIADMGDQNYYVYFTRPGDVRKTAVLTLKHADGADDRWLYIPSVDLVKRIAASNSRSRFIGSDFTYEDVSGRLPLLDSNVVMPNEELNGKSVTVIKSTPLNENSAEFAWKKTWIDPETKLPLQEEYYNKTGTVTRRMTVDSIRIVEDIPTAISRTMIDLKSNHSTTISFESLTYKVELKADQYHERLLKSPPASLR
jgi:hypothetical protein